MKDTVSLCRGPSFFSFKGRAPRSEWWQATILQAILLALIVGIVRCIDGDAEMVVVLLGAMILIWMEFSKNIRRMHDGNHAAWVGACLSLLFPSVGLYFLIQIIYCGCKRGTIGANRFGPDPLEKI